MKKLLFSIIGLIFLSISIHAVDRPNLSNAQWTNVDNDPAKPAVVLVWTDPQVKPDAYEIQRKLFPWGWRKMAVINGQNAAWADHKPAKREASYRMRSLSGAEKSKWSRTVKISR